jgi:hypothetical protein
LCGLQRRRLMELCTALFIASLPHAHANSTASMTACLLTAYFGRPHEPFPRGFPQTCQSGHPAAHLIRRGQKALGPSSAAALAAKDGGMNGAGRLTSFHTIDGRLFIPLDEVTICTARGLKLNLPTLRFATGRIQGPHMCTCHHYAGGVLCPSSTAAAVYRHRHRQKRSAFATG